MWAFFTAHALDDLRCAESAADDPVRDSVAKEFLADIGNTGDLDTEGEQGMYNDYAAINATWADTTNMDNLRGADITASTVAGSVETFSSNVTHEDSSYTLGSKS